MQVKVVFTYIPEPEEVDNSDSTGLTAAAYEILERRLDEIGATDVDIRKVP